MLFRSQDSEPPCKAVCTVCARLLYVTVICRHPVSYTHLDVYKRQVQPLSPLQTVFPLLFLIFPIIRFLLLLKYWNRWEVFGGVDWSQMHRITEEYTKEVPDSGTPDHCISCGACTKKCPFNLPIPKLMEAAAKNLRRY